jgi:Flp pilus assembly protein TadD
MFFKYISKNWAQGIHRRGLSLVTLSFAFVGCQSFQSYSEAEDLEKQTLNTRISIAADLIDRGQAATALSDLRILLTEQPDNPSVLTMNAIAHLALDNNRQALNLQNKAYKIEDSTAMGVTLASILIVNNRLDTAEKLLLKLSRDEAYQFPERVLQNLGYLYEKKGKTNLAITQYKKALSLNPTYFPVMSLLGRAYEKIGNQVNATQVYKNAALVCSTCYEPINLLFQQMILKNKHQEALTLVDTYLKERDLLPENRNLALQLKKRAEAMKIKQAASDAKRVQKGG